jgi:threonine/homoserine/homoserine lactone efflux protein
MLDWLPSRPLLTTFLVASLVLAVTPGPGVLYIVARSLLQGRRVALASVAGVALGNLGNAFGAAAVSRPLSRARGIRPGGRYLTGGALIGLGVYTALSGSRDGAG